MRTFLASVILLCLFGGAYLLSGPAFFMPSRSQPGYGIQLEGVSSQLLGAALCLLAALGLMAARQAARGGRRAAPYRWQQAFFGLTVLAIVLMASAFSLGTAGPNPDRRPSSPPAVIESSND